MSAGRADIRVLSRDAVVALDGIDRCDIDFTVMTDEERAAVLRAKLSRMVAEPLMPKMSAKYFTGGALGITSVLGAGGGDKMLQVPVSWQRSKKMLHKVS